MAVIYEAMLLGSNTKFCNNLAYQVQIKMFLKTEGWKYYID